MFTNCKKLPNYSSGKTLAMAKPSGEGGYFTSTSSMFNFCNDDSFVDSEDFENVDNEAFEDGDNSMDENESTEAVKLEDFSLENLLELIITTTA